MSGHRGQCLRRATIPLDPRVNYQISWILCEVDPDPRSGHLPQLIRLLREHCSKLAFLPRRDFRPRHRIWSHRFYPWSLATNSLFCKTGTFLWISPVFRKSSPLFRNPLQAGLKSALNSKWPSIDSEDKCYVHTVARGPFIPVTVLLFLFLRAILQVIPFGLPALKSWD